MSINAEKKHAHKLRQERLANGLCKECDNPRGTNLDGSLSKFCDDHRAMFASRTAKHQRPNSSNVRYDADGDYFTYLDTKGFEAYADIIASAIGKLGRASIGDLRRHLEDAFNDRYFFDAIERLEGMGVIKQVNFGSISRWSIATDEVKKLPTKWNRDRQMVPTVVRRPDDASVYGNGRRVMA